MAKFKVFLIQTYRLSEKSAEDYIGRFKGIVKRGIYNGEQGTISNLKVMVEREYPKSLNNYILTLERYIEFLKYCD